MTDFQFTREQKTLLVDKIKDYFERELDQDIAQFDAEFLLDFFAETIGPHCYNQGLYDARNLIEQKVELITDSFYEIEKSTDFR